MKKPIIFLTTLLSLLFLNFSVLAQFDSQVTYTTYEAKIREVREEHRNESGGYYQRLVVEIETGNRQGELYEVENGFGDSLTSQKYSVGDRLVLTGYLNEEGPIFFISDYIRRSSLPTLFVIFILVSVVIAGKRGVASLLSMVFTFLVIFWLVLPKISSGTNPVLIIILFSLTVVPVTFYLSHGFNQKTTAAVLGTFLALSLTIILAVVFVRHAKLTGFTSDEASFLRLLKGDLLNMQGIILAGIIVGVLGVLDDITVSQSAIVFQLKNSNKRLSFWELFKRSMDVGKDHIASMVNTLVLVYAGASLPLLLLFIDSGRTFGEVINFEVVASEIIRMLVGSIGLMLAVPITTFIACTAADASMSNA